MERLKLILGTIVLMALIVLACTIALGHVEEKTSFGLTGIIAILGKVVLDFSQWAYTVYHKDKDDATRDHSAGR
jgi:hypothetical protein